MKTPALAQARMVRIYRSAVARGVERARVRVDAAEDDTADAIFRQLRRIAADIDDSATDYVSRVAQVNRTRFVQSGRVGFWRQMNVQLIRTVEAETVQALQELFAKHPEGPTLAQIHHVADVSAARAKFWARDQALKLNSQIVQERALSVGITEYDWDARDDGKTREMHWALNGRTFSLLTEGPVTNPQGDHNHAGEDYNCRCTMRLHT